MADESHTRFYLRGRPGDLDADLTWKKVARYGRRAEIVATERLTETGTVRISFRVADEQPFAFSPGQWIGLEEEVPGVGPRRSSYCIFSPPTDDGRFDLLLRVLPDGPLSQHLVTLDQGYQVRFRGPLGRSMIPRPSDTDLVLLATGVGIAPLYSLLGHLRSSGEQRPVRFFWGLRLTEDICLRNELAQLTEGLVDFRYQISLSQPPDDWPQLRGRVTESVPPLIDRLGGKRFYLSGNGAMIEEMELALCALGVDRTSISEERFFNANHHADRATMDAIMARFVADDVVAPDVNLRTRVWRVTEPE
jgi:propane monooxygenase reductase component